LVAGYYAVRARRDARRARAVNEALGFVNGLIRHDLRNDLSVIEGYAELSAEEEESAELDGNSAAVIAGKAEEALDRIETTRAVTETLLGEHGFEPVDLVEPTEALAARTEETFDVSVTVDAPERAVVAANAGVRSVVDNLLENAVEHNDADEPRIEIRIEPEDDAVRLTVRDNGPGIPEEERAAVLEAGEGGASGLSLTRTLVEGYGGELSIEPVEPRGTAVTAAFPRP